MVAGDTCDTTLVVGWEGDANAYILCHIQNHFCFLLIKWERVFMALESNTRSQEMRNPESEASATEGVQKGRWGPWNPVWNQTGRYQPGKLRGHLMAVE